MIDGIDIPCLYKDGKQYVPKSAYIKTKNGFEKRGSLKFTLRIKGDELTPLFTLAQSPKVTLAASKLYKSPGKVTDWATPPMFLRAESSDGTFVFLSLDTENGHVITVDDVRTGGNKFPTMVLEGDFGGEFDADGSFIICPKEAGSIKYYAEGEKVHYRIAVLDHCTKEVKVFEREYTMAQDVEQELHREGILHDDTDFMTTVVGENALKVTIE